MNYSPNEAKYIHNYTVNNILPSFVKFVKYFLDALEKSPREDFSVLFVTKVIDDFGKDDILYRRQSLRAWILFFVCVISGVKIEC